MKLTLSQRLAILAVFGALTAVFYPIPFAFLIPLIVASLLFDFLTSFILSAVLGCISLLFSLIGSAPLSMAFLQFPYVAIVPRLLIGPAVFGTFRLLKKLCGKAQSPFVNTVIPAALASAIGALVNTAGVLGLFALVGGETSVMGSSLSVWLAGWGVNGVIEAAICLVVCPAIRAVGHKVLVHTSFRSGR